MIALLLSAVLLAPQDEYLQARGQELLEAGRFGDAQLHFESVEDPLLRKRSLVDLYFQARDFPAALAAAKDGLALGQEDGALLYRAASACMWLGAAEQAAGFSERLERWIQGAQLSDSERELWQGALGELRTMAREEVARQESRRSALARGRWSALSLLAGTLVLLILGSRLPQS